MAKAARKPVNLTMDAELIAEAHRYGLNLSAHAEEGLKAAVKAERWRRWQEENREAIESHNALIRREGLWTERIPGWWNDFKAKE